MIMGLLLVATSFSAVGKVKTYGISVVKSYPHDVTSYTQGLFFYDGKLYESTGQFGNSTLRIVDIETGEAIQKASFGKKYFMEGSVVLNDKLYLLTWMNKVAFIYDPATLTYESTYSYPRDGWGLTTDGKQLIATDGSADLFFMDEKFFLKNRITVKMNGRPIRQLNELEYIDGKIWANVYTSDLLLIIDPSTGNVEATVDCTGLLPDSLRTSTTDVLNGIAYDPATRRLFHPGKNWPRHYQVSHIEK